MKSLWPFSIHAPCWDQALLAEIVSGQAWPIPGQHGATIVVASGSLLGGSSPEARDGFLERVAALPAAVVVHTSDEGQAHPWSHQWPAWSQYWNPDTPLKDAKPLLLGAPPDARRILADIPRRPAAERARWFFSGQVQNKIRRACVDELRERSDGALHVSPGFLKGLGRVEYLSGLAGAAIAPCPAGNVHPDTMRLYEALEAGCLPVANRRYEPGWPNTTNYWWTVLGEGFEPFPCVNDWTELPGVFRRYEDNPGWLQRDTNRATAWWIGYKRQLALDLAEEGGYDFGPVTVLMPTSPIPDHPSTACIEDSIRRVRAYPGLERADIIIMVDGVREEQEGRTADYEEYKRRLIDLCNWHPDFWGCFPLVFDEFTHQANMARYALELVRTPLIFYVEHDTYPVGALDFPVLFRTFEEAPQMNVLRFSIFDAHIPEHAHLFPNGPTIRVPDGRLIPTIQWSQRPHLARTDWYRQQMTEWFGSKARTMIEDTMFGLVFERVKRGLDKWQDWGIYLYEPASGGLLRSDTSDGRKKDPKFSMQWCYDGPVPEGAPAPGVR